MEGIEPLANIVLHRRPLSPLAVPDKCTQSGRIYDGGYTQIPCGSDTLRWSTQLNKSRISKTSDVPDTTILEQSVTQVGLA